MGKMVIPKNTASLEEVMGAIQIYYDVNGWLSNPEYIETYKSRLGVLGDDRDKSAYTKKTEIGAYYGFIEWQDINNVQSPRRITPRGRKFLEHYNSGDTDAVHEDLMKSLEEVSFGRNNYACRSCDSDIEPPALFLRAMMDLGHLTNTEFAYLVYQMEYKGQHYTDTIQEIKDIRKADMRIDLPEDAKKFSDPKPILILERWGVLSSSQNGNSKETSISASFMKKYEQRLRNLKIYNIDKSNYMPSIPDFVALTPEWFKEKAQEFTADDREAATMYSDFNNRFGIDALSQLSGEDLLKTLFLGASSDNLCHELEYVSRNAELFGSVKGGSSFKYPMFFDKESSMWTSGTRTNPKQLSLDEAVIKGTAIRDGLVNGAKIIKDLLPVDSVDDYLSLYTALYSAIPELVDSLWVIKYFHMLFPEFIPVFYNKDWQIRVLTALKITPNDTAYGRLGQINAFVKECGITNVAFARVFHKYCRNVSVDEHEDIGLDVVASKRITGGTNVILYGVPGSGKSWTIKDEYCNDDSRMERLVFYPDYTYSDFVGQILPKVADDGSVSYEFSAGPFTKLLRKAYVNPDKKYYLIIEEVNRGNAPAIFGDVFQLLDRNKDGSSEYAITNEDIAEKVYLNKNHKVSIPSNMSILCTMNTSDQNVFTLDTAFQRRWNMRLIKNEFNKNDPEERRFAETKIVDTSVTWENFIKTVNDFILDKNIRMTSSEDKRLGTHFVSEEDLITGDGTERQFSRFPEKVLKYLWDDAFKFTKEDIFDLDRAKSLERVIDLFVNSTGNDRLRIFKDNIYDALVNKQDS